MAHSSVPGLLKVFKKELQDVESHKGATADNHNLMEQMMQIKRADLLVLSEQRRDRIPLQSSPEISDPTIIWVKDTINLQERDYGLGCDFEEVTFFQCLPHTKRTCFTIRNRTEPG